MDIIKIRKGTIGCEGQVFLNSAGSSLMPATVAKSITDYIRLEEKYGGYDVAKMKSVEIIEFYTEIGKLLNCQAKNIAFMYNATDAYSKALSAIPFREGDCILTTNDDYISNQIAFISLQKRFGIKIVRAKNLPDGNIDFDDFEQLAKTCQPKLVSLTHIPTNSGLIQNAEKVGEICQQENIWYLLDACQAVGQIAVDVQKIKCDFLSATGRKFLRGPRGTGFLYISDRVINEKLEPLFIDMQGARWTQFENYEVEMSGKRFEEWEFSYASLIGLKEAVRYVNSIGIREIQARNTELANKLRTELSQIPNTKVLDKGTNLGSIITVHVAGIELAKLCDLLSQHKIIHSVSHKEYALIDFTKKGVDWAIRLSPHYFNTMDEIENTIKVFSKIAEDNAKM